MLAPGGALFVYTHVRKNAPIAAGLRWINALARGSSGSGLIDLRQEHLRKSDHLNPLRDIPELEQVARDAGFRIARIRYYTPIVGGFVENILMRMAERAMARRAARRLRPSMAPRLRTRGRSAKRGPPPSAQIASSPATYAALRALSFAMKLDLLLFGRIRRVRSSRCWSRSDATGARCAIATDDEDPLLRAVDQTVPGTNGRIGPCHARSPRASRRSATRCTCS